ncbi:hypothetical protein EVAR_33682_1 [Eumeta japonica]|uniref:Uncharacterized protein n=1 Tax=Eumeta variegata TaxID=151549 RepID=A0A4C1VM17_EUMVA|nr:hypothetical protein EVAR_33682_1 [Eumeta japonica]
MDSFSIGCCTNNMSRRWFSPPLRRPPRRGSAVAMILFSFLFPGRGLIEIFRGNATKRLALSRYAVNAGPRDRPGHCAATAAPETDSEPVTLP